MGTIKQVTRPAPEPGDVMTRIAGRAIKAAETHPEARPDDDEIVVLARRPVGTGPDGTEYIGGLGTNITDPGELLQFLLIALRSHAAANGIPLRVIEAGRDS